MAGGDGRYTPGAMKDEATFRVKAGLAEMLKGGVIMDVVTPEQAKIAEEAGAAAVMALERVPADIRRDGGVARMSDPVMVKGIQDAVTIPVMAKARIGHPGDAALLANVGGDALERHHRARARVFSDARLLRVRDVHDHAALEHLGETRLYPHGSGFSHGKCLFPGG